MAKRVKGGRTSNSSGSYSNDFLAITPDRQVNISRIPRALIGAPRRTVRDLSLLRNAKLKMKRDELVCGLKDDLVDLVS